MTALQATLAQDGGQMTLCMLCNAFALTRACLMFSRRKSSKFIPSMNCMLLLSHSKAMHSPVKVHHCDVSNILRVHAADFARESKELTGWLKRSSPSLFQWLQLSGRWPLPLLSHPHKTFMCSHGKQHSDALNSNISQKQCATTKRTPWPSRVQHAFDKQIDTNVLAQLWHIQNCYLNRKQAALQPSLRWL